MLYFIIFILIIFVVFIYWLNNIRINLNKKEEEIRSNFTARTNMIPAIFEITKNDFTKHDEIFKDILKYRKQELYRYYIQEETDNIDNDFVKLIHLEELIHNELNFIFKVANKHPKLQKKWNFIYLRDLMIQKSYKLWKLLSDYKQKIKIYNKLINIKNFTILWIFIPIGKKHKI